MNKILGILLMLLMGMVQAGIIIDEVGTAFTYQGELLANGSPANGTYDMRFYLFTDGTNGFSLDDVSLDDVVVENGWFQVDLDFGDTYFSGSALWLEIEIEAAGSAAEILSPRQRLRTTPYAIQASYVTNGSALWQQQGSDIYYNDAVIVGNQNTTTSSLLTIDSSAAESPLRVKINGATRLITRDNGGTSIGVNTSAPENGLRVEGISRLVGNTELKGDLQQDLDNNGAIKAAVTVNCRSPLSSIEKSFNGVNDLPITIYGTSSTGVCIIDFPFDVDERFIVAMAASESANNVASCAIIGSTDNLIRCSARNLISGNNVNYEINILVY